MTRMQINLRGAPVDRDGERGASGRRANCQSGTGGFVGVVAIDGAGGLQLGKCVSGGTAPCFHYTAKNFNLSDGRPTTKGGSTAVDLGNVWVVWDSAATTNVWAFIKVDSGVGDRCYFAQPHCNVNITTFPAPANLITSTLWGDSSSDATPPSTVSALFTSGTSVGNAAATDIRPEDALFATCRANSKLGGGPDSLAGLGYGTSTAGSCPAFGSSLAALEGTDILSAYPASTSTAHLLAFTLSGKDPFTGTTVPTWTSVSVGAAPIVFITQRTGALALVKNATDSQLHEVFGGTLCDASAFGAPRHPSKPICASRFPAP